MVDVAAGNNFSLVLSAEGTVFSFGCGKVLFTLQQSSIAVELELTTPIPQHRTVDWARATRATPPNLPWSLPRATRSQPYRPATATAWSLSDHPKDDEAQPCEYSTL